MSSVIVAEGKVVVEADASKLPAKIAKDMEGGGSEYDRAGKSIGGSVFGGVVGAWAAIGGTQAVVGWFSGAVTGASDLNETMSKASAIFGDNSKGLAVWGDTAAKYVGLSKEAAIAAATSFGDMFTQIGFAGDEALNMSRKTVQMSADLGSFSNLETADVADRISAAFRGEYDSLQAVIPNINAARVESEALAASGKTVASELTAQEKATAVLAIVNKDGARAMGDFARTADGAANSAKTATASLQDQQAKLGSQLLPVWQGFLGFLNATAIPAFGSLVEWVGKNSDTVLMLAGTVAAAALAFGIATVAGNIYKAYQLAAAASTSGLTVAQWALNTAMSANPVGIVIVLLAALVAAVIWVATQTTFFRDAWANVTSFIGTAWQWLWDSVLNPVFTAIGGVFTWLYNSIILPVVTGIMVYVGLWAGVITWLWRAVVSPVLTAIGGAFSWIWASVISPVVGFIGNAIRTVGAVFSWLWGSAINPTLQAVAGGFNWVWSNVVSPVVGFISGAISSVGNTVRNVFNGIAGVIGGAFQAALGVARGPINGLIGLVNGAIRSLNSLRVTIPDWVPMVGGQTWGLNLPRIPMLARGTNNAPDAFIAGENGPELITGAQGSTVRPYSVTQDLLMRDRGGDTGNADIVAAIRELSEQLKNMPRGDVLAEVNFPDTEDARIKARQFARELNDYLVGG